MKVIDVKIFVVANPPPHAGGRYFIFTKLTTDSNVVGYGEIYAAAYSPNIITSMAMDIAERYLINEDPHHIERFFRRTYSSGFLQRPDPCLIACVSGLEIAMWDIIGKEAGKPIYELLGGRIHQSLRSYTYLYPESGSVYPEENQDNKTIYNDPDMAAEAAIICVEKQGFTAVKFDPAGVYTVYDPHQPRLKDCLLYTSPSPRDKRQSRMPSSA